MTGFEGGEVSEQPFLTRDDVAAIGGVDPATVSRYLTRSRPGERYAEDPFPAPDGRRGKRWPWWRLERRGEIAAWFARHREIKGGRPPKGAAS